MLLKLSIKLKSTWAAKWGDSLFKLGRYNRVFKHKLGTNPYMSPYVETVICGEFSLTKILQKNSQWPTKVHFFHKTSKWEKWWSWWFRMTNAFILCNLLWKVQKSIAANRKGSFKYGASYTKLVYTGRSTVPPRIIVINWRLINQKMSDLCYYSYMYNVHSY